MTTFFPVEAEDDMIAGKHVPILFILILTLCSLIGPVVAADYFSNGGYFSTGTTVSVKGTVNETVSIQYITHDEGITKTTEWVSSQTLKDPSALSWNSQMSVGTKDDSLWWDFQMKGLPVTWKKTQTQTVLPVTWKGIQSQTVLPVTWKGIQTQTVLPVTWKKLYLF